MVYLSCYGCPLNQFVHYFNFHYTLDSRCRLSLSCAQKIKLNKIQHLILLHCQHLFSRLESQNPLTKSLISLNNTENSCAQYL